MKICPDCRQMKALEDFPPAKKRSDGRSTYCRACMNKRSKESYRKRRDAQGKTVREPRTLPPGERWCPDCESVKPETDFPRNRSTKTGFASYCKPCHNKRTRENVIKNQGSTREAHLRRRYGIDQGGVDRMLRSQSNLCAGCGRSNPGHVDHDHRSGHVRGMLCFNCNQALGNVRDDIRVLKQLRHYVIARDPWLARLKCAGHKPPKSLVILVGSEAFPHRDA